MANELANYKAPSLAEIFEDNLEAAFKGEQLMYGCVLIHCGLGGWLSKRAIFEDLKTTK